MTKISGPRLGLWLAVCLSASGQSLPNLFPLPNGSGLVATSRAGGGSVELGGAFFQALGSNGRSCGSCHRPGQGWSITPEEVKLRFLLTQGLDPLFRTNDGSNCDQNVDTSTFAARWKAYSLLLNRGLIRVALPAPANAEFNVVGVMNQYGCQDTMTLSMYRRPLPSANLRFLSTVMWDGRESSALTGTKGITYATNPTDLLENLAHQSVDATNGHAAGLVNLTAAQQKAIVDFEMALSTAQIYDYRAGWLNDDGATGGPSHLGGQTTSNFFIGINDPLGQNPKGTAFTPVVFNLFDAWTNQKGGGNDQRRARASIVRGQTLFNSKPIAITGVGGLNDDLNVAAIPGTCGTCHDALNAGNHSVAAPLNIGVGDVDSPLDVSYLPVITLQNKVTHEIKKTTDPGRAMISGLWKDVGRLKGPVLRGLASRAPYFHNGSAQSLDDVVEFYDKRFSIKLTPQEKDDLVAFLKTL